MNIDVKLFNKNPEKPHLPASEKDYTPWPRKNLECKEGYIPSNWNVRMVRYIKVSVINDVNKLEKKHMIISVDAERAFDKIHDNTQQTRNGRKLPQHDKAQIWKTPNQHYIPGERMKAFPLRSGPRQGFWLLQLRLNMIPEVPAREMEKVQEQKASSLERKKLISVDRWQL